MCLVSSISELLTQLKDHVAQCRFLSRKLLRNDIVKVDLGGEEMRTRSVRISSPHHTLQPAVTSKDPSADGD